MRTVQGVSHNGEKMITKLINSLDKLHAVSPDAAKAYETEEERLVNYVNNELEANPNIFKLIGGNPLDLMRNNHNNHAVFMATVFKIGSHELLGLTEGHPI